MIIKDSVKLAKLVSRALPTLCLMESVLLAGDDVKVNISIGVFFAGNFAGKAMIVESTLSFFSVVLSQRQLIIKCWTYLYDVQFKFLQVLLIMLIEYFKPSQPLFFGLLCIFNWFATNIK